MDHREDACIQYNTILGNTTVILETTHILVSTIILQDIQPIREHLSLPTIFKFHLVTRRVALSWLLRHMGSVLWGRPKATTADQLLILCSVRAVVKCHWPQLDHLTSTNSMFCSATPESWNQSSAWLWPLMTQNTQSESVCCTSQDSLDFGTHSKSTAD